MWIWQSGEMCINKETHSSLSKHVVKKGVGAVNGVLEDQLKKSMESVSGQLHWNVGCDIHLDNCHPLSASEKYTHKYGISQDSIFWVVHGTHCVLWFWCKYIGPTYGDDNNICSWSRMEEWRWWPSSILIPSHQWRKWYSLYYNVTWPSTPILSATTRITMCPMQLGLALVVLWLPIPPLGVPPQPESPCHKCNPLC